MCALGSSALAIMVLSLGADFFVVRDHQPNFVHVRGHHHPPGPFHSFLGVDSRNEVADVIHAALVHVRADLLAEDLAHGIFVSRNTAGI